MRPWQTCPVRPGPSSAASQTWGGGATSSANGIFSKLCRQFVSPGHDGNNGNDSNESPVLLAHRQSGIPVETGQVFTTTAKDPKALPSYELLELQWNILQLAAMSGAADVQVHGPPVFFIYPHPQLNSYTARLRHIPNLTRIQHAYDTSPSSHVTVTIIIS